MLLGKIESFVFGMVTTIAAIEAAVIYLKASDEAEWRHRPFGYKTCNKTEVGPENKNHIGFV